MDSENKPLSEKPVKSKFLPIEILRTLHAVVFISAIAIMTMLYGAVTFVTVIFSRRLARKIARVWSLHLLGLGGVKVNVAGGEKLDKGERYVFMSNHQSALDIPIIYAGISEKISFIAKKELFMIPIFGWGMWAVGHISIDRESPRKAHASIAKAVQKLNRENVSLILFPEGTRSKDGKVLDFKTASFTLALQADVKLVPVAIKNAIDRLPPKTTRIVPGEVFLEIGDPIAVEEFQGSSKGEICARVHGVIKGMAERECC
ncbi:MAG: 1-acyl-sn-glycerol-3-phosphate acyltransferase [Chitinispirillales bacterium]|jgi:1-acyl-sn-glycerol-3-phosphate acyltransferase|nr:1-acyl-sn-glycerol-3-phosphate acyltransferase [Chitinispirillales bacterium]